MGMAADSSGQVVVAYLGAGEGAGKITRVNPADGLFHAVAPMVAFMNLHQVCPQRAAALWVRCE